MTPANETELDAPRYASGTPAAWPLYLLVLGALMGCVFSALSSSDFMQHLDRQVHAIHCSFIPGAGKELGESGCKAVMMSPYSSFFRESVWGGIPVSLWALATFAFLAYRALNLLWRGKTTQAETRFLLAATALPVLMSVVYGFLSVAKVGSTCKVCVGIYVSSALVFIGAVLNHKNNPAPAELVSPNGKYARWFFEGVTFVLVLSLTYVVFAPKSDAKKSMSGCGALVSADDPNGVMLSLSTKSGTEPAIEVLDPLCPACKAFDARLATSALREKLDLKAVLFPLDPSCNWMVTEALHPGACAMSEALLCAAGFGATKDDAAALEVLRWAFKQQDALRELAAKDEPAMRAKIEAAFPKVKGCLGGAVVKNKLTKSLRWAVANAIPVLTPQLFVGNARMCDEDTDLGLEYTLAKMLSPKGKTARAAVKPPPVPKPAPAPAPTPKPAAPKPAAPPAETAPSEDAEEGAE